MPRLLNIIKTHLISTLLVLIAIPAHATGILYQLPYRWLNDDGKAMTLRDFQGKPTVLVMAYGACKKICSTSLYRMEQMQAILDQKKIEAQFVIVSLDPKTDTPEDWHQYRAMRKLNRSNWSFLSGSPNDIRSLAGQLGINYWIYHDHVVHDFVITLLDNEGNTVNRMLNGGEDLPQFLKPIYTAN